jgi:addiction module RelB/DinJ family antitoxin
MSNLDKTIINIKIDKQLKRQAQEVSNEIGVPLTTVISANLKEFVRSRTLSVSALSRLRPEVERELVEAVEDYKKGKNVSKAYTDPDAAASHIDSL